MVEEIKEATQLQNSDSQTIEPKSEFVNLVLDADTPVITDSVAEQVKQCPRCTKCFPPSKASKVDPQFCSDCLVDVTVTDETFVRTEEEYDEDSDTLIRHTQKARKISFQGADWMFYTRAIQHLSDEELKAFIEYHRAVVGMMENEITQRKVKVVQTGLRVNGSTITIKRTTEKKSKSTVKQKPLDINALVATLKAAGIDPDKLSDMLAKMKGGKP